jgi:hypothetical protein
VNQGLQGTRPDGTFGAVRRIALAVAAAVLLALAPSALAWTTLSSAVSNTVVPAILVTQQGSVLEAWDSPLGGTIALARNGTAPKTLVSGDPVANRVQLVQQQSGAIQLYYPNAQGVGRLTSTDDGQTWSGNQQTQSHAVGPVMAAAVAPDGTPYFSQDSTAGINVFRGLNGETVANVFPRCCGYAESLAVDSSGLVQVAFYSNADPDGTFMYERLGPSLNVTGSTPLKPTAPHDDRVPLVSDRSGNTFIAWPPGYPTATALSVVPFSGGAPAGDGVSFRGPFSGGDPHMALTVDTADRLWVVWTSNGAVHAARSRSHGRHFGAVVSAGVPGTSYQVSAAGIDGSPGKVDVTVNTGSSLVEQSLPPGLSARATTTKKKVGKKTVVTHWVQALDDGVPVPTAAFTIRGRSYKADAAGKARVPAGSGKAAAPGYAAASFRTR